MVRKATEKDAPTLAEMAAQLWEGHDIHALEEEFAEALTDSRTAQNSTWLWASWKQTASSVSKNPFESIYGAGHRPGSFFYFRTLTEVDACDIFPVESVCLSRPERSLKV